MSDPLDTSPSIEAEPLGGRRGDPLLTEAESTAIEAEEAAADEMAEAAEEAVEAVVEATAEDLGDAELTEVEEVTDRAGVGAESRTTARVAGTWCTPTPATRTR